MPQHLKRNLIRTHHLDKSEADDIMKGNNVKKRVTFNKQTKKYKKVEVTTDDTEGKPT